MRPESPTHISRGSCCFVNSSAHIIDIWSKFFPQTFAVKFEN